MNIQKDETFWERKIGSPVMRKDSECHVPD